MNTQTSAAFRETSPELFPHLGADRKSMVRRIGVVCDVQRCSKAMWSRLPPRTASGLITLNHGIAQQMRNSLCSDEARLAVYDYFADYMPLDTDIEAMGIDALRQVMSTITAAARADEIRYRERFGRVSA